MENIEVLKRCRLFKNVGEENIMEIVNAADGRMKRYGEGHIVFKRGSSVKHIGILLSGRVYAGGCGEFCRGDIFGIESALCRTGCRFEVKALEETEILFINFKKLLKCSGKGYSFYYRIIENMLENISEKNIKNDERLYIISNYKLRNKLLEFFKVQKQIHGNDCFGLNMSRTELAEYLCVDRCPLSRELTKLQKEGIVEIDKQKIVIKAGL